MRIIDAKNSTVRKLWSMEIVGVREMAGLKFSETWREDGVEAGPLPSVFLRESAESLGKNPVRLSSYVGSDYPNSFHIYVAFSYE